MNDILVSINCITYNHEEYIRDAIESFLMQRINFKFEILIHDDASTDKTTEIIREYHEKYPEIIKPIYQMENKYSKGIKVGKFNYSRAKGKYIALCEGDDYWTDPYKLQKQVDFMEANPEYSMCGHKTEKYNVETESFVGSFPNHSASKELTFNNLIQALAFHTSSILINREKMLNSSGDVVYPKYYLSSPVGDYALHLYMFTLGKVYFINETMSHYNWNVDVSWTKKVLNGIESKNSHTLKMIDMLLQFNEETHYRYNEFVQQAIQYRKSQLFLESDDKLINLPRLLKILNDKERIYIFGAGAFGQSVSKLLRDNNIKVNGYIDNDKAKVGTKVNDQLVHSLKMIEENSIILVCSQWHKEISKQLLDNGFNNYYTLISWQV